MKTSINRMFSVESAGDVKDSFLPHLNKAYSKYFSTKRYFVGNKDGKLALFKRVDGHPKRDNSVYHRDLNSEELEYFNAYQTLKNIHQKYVDEANEKLDKATEAFHESIAAE